MVTNIKYLADGQAPSQATALARQAIAADKKSAAPSAQSANNALAMQGVQVEKQLTSLKAELATIDTKLREITRVLSGRPIFVVFVGERYNLSWVKTVGYRGTTSLTLLTKQQVEQIRRDLLARQLIVKNKITQLTGTLTNIGASIGKPPVDPSQPGSGGGGLAAAATGAVFSATIKYNASVVKEAYFYTGMSFFDTVDPDWSGRGATDRFDSSVWAGNTPQKVNDAMELWKSNRASKGIIQTWTPPGGAAGFIKDGNWADLKTAASIQRYGFQFVYNPTTISMTYGGVADVDPGFAASGKEEFLPANPSVFQSTITLELVINRLFDFKYLSSNGLKSGQISDYYAGNVPSKKDLKEIYKKGTMYDVEYLLQSMFPYEPLPSQLRGKTSDVGYLGAMPVELHLGNNLRYVAQVNGINVNHVIFDNRMVPMFTTITISTNRIPDYQGVQNDLGTSTTSSTVGTSGSAGGPKGSLTNPVVPGGGSLVGGRGIL